MTSKTSFTILVSLLLAFLAFRNIPRSSPRPNSVGEKVSHTVETVTFTMVSVPIGSTFIMGEHEEDRVQGVTLSEGFWMAQTEVTQGLWQEVMDGFWPGAADNQMPSDEFGLGPEYPA